MEDGEETKSDFLARMILMGRVDIDEQNKTLKSNITCKEEDPTTGSLPASRLPNPCCEDNGSGCDQYNVIAKGFFSTYQQKIQDSVLDGARKLIFEASKSKEVSLVSDGDSVKNESNTLVDEWHHKYDVKFTVAASQDPRLYLSRYFDENIEQLGDSAVKISYIETQKI